MGGDKKTKYNKSIYTEIEKLYLTLCSQIYLQKNPSCTYTVIWVLGTDSLCRVACSTAEGAAHPEDH